MRFKVLAFVCLALLLTGCQILVPFINMYHESGLSEADRKMLLKPQVKIFIDALRTNDIDTALGCVDEDYPEIRDELLDQVRAARRKEQVVSSETDMILFSDEARKASVDILVKYFEIPYYVVNQRLEKQEWFFTLSDKWKLRSRKIEKVDAN